VGCATTTSVATRRPQNFNTDVAPHSPAQIPAEKGR
jgi:hypothetical protein